MAAVHRRMRQATVHHRCLVLSGVLTTNGEKMRGGDKEFSKLGRHTPFTFTRKLGKELTLCLPDVLYVDNLAVFSR